MLRTSEKSRRGLCVQNCYVDAVVKNTMTGRLHYCIYLDVVKEDMREVGAREGEVFVRRCGDPWWDNP